MSAASGVSANLPRDLGDDPDRLLSVANIVGLSGLSEGLVRRELAEGKLPSCRFGRRRQVRFADYRSWIAAKRSGGDQ